jgi:lycopene beta-cyclase
MSGFEYEYLIAGGGAAGLSLADRLAHNPATPGRILIVDRDDKRKNDRTWCFWVTGDGPYREIHYRRWEQLRFDAPGFERVYRLAPYTSVMIRGIDFYEHLRARLVASGRVDFRQGSLDGLADDGDAACATVDGQTVRGRWAFTSIVNPADLAPRPGRDRLLWQHFKGWIIQTPEPRFDPTLPALFDFRTPQDGAMRFLYILPFGPREALVEYTLFSGRLLAPAEYEAALRDYIPNTLGIHDYAILEEEAGQVPMTDRPFERRLGERILAIGTRGGRVKPSSGYAFLRIQRDVDAIAASLARHGHPFSLPRDSARYRWLDAVMLAVMDREGGRMAGIFTDMFRRNPIDRIFRFLDETAGLPEDLRLMATLPWPPFIRASLRTPPWK